MKLKLSLAAAMFAVASLSACGGGGNDTPTPSVYSPAALSKTDISVGTGAEAVAAKTVKVHYTGWLYNTNMANFKGTQFDSSAGKAPFTFTIGTNQVIPGFEQGVLGMRVGGKRTVVIPSSLGYGANGNSVVPPNSGLVFEMELVEVL
ncbi:FKBP-type peptidyl-prolyl cis-trans isomerase [Massilia sp. CF038]|uniref:FKBP-type peptidyl-prolyl cis-trans isomerase n=1 Tax=Massilia sp. CF038 TaxID=1881045 RepID=UPI0009147803|nr:FKBP-type peptidyl-prolyl cis-trans isomerase [Massilia sp. CF038]SHH42685.1 FKBP-type peptidyl-prolyl cis-trans isomerase FkpA [Massilia sp. CF038]